jgi:hypothetical protein
MYKPTLLAKRMGVGDRGPSLYPPQFCSSWGVTDLCGKVDRIKALCEKMLFSFDSRYFHQKALDAKEVMMKGI